MLKLDSISFSRQPEDKPHDFSSSITEDPLNDLFDQFISHESSSAGDNDNQPSIFEPLDFPLNDSRFNNSGISDILPKNYANPKVQCSHEPRQAYIRYTQSQEILPSQVYPKFARFERPQAAISSVELLNLEGKLPVQALPVRSTPSLSSTVVPVPPLRRKARFNTNPSTTIRYQNNKVFQSPGAETVEAPKMIRPTSYRHEMPFFQERFDKISLQSPLPNPPVSPLSSEPFFQDERQPSTVPTTGSPQRRLEQGETCSLGHIPSKEDSLSKISGFGLLPSPAVSPSFNGMTHQNQMLSFNSHREARNRASQTVNSPPPSLSPSWLQSPESIESFDYIISPNQKQSGWPHDFSESPTLHYENAGASQSVPILPQPDTEFSALYPMIPQDPFEPFVTTNPSNAYNIALADPFQSTDFDVSQPFSPSSAALNRPKTPSTRSPSPFPSPPPDSKPHSKTRRRSKTSRRKSSAGALKSSTGLGFVNFTPGDSQKILSGVAPSGSSKTKARREQEANEKKRKFSLEAVKAIKEAGGDVEKLRAVGLFDVNLSMQ